MRTATLRRLGPFLPRACVHIAAPPPVALSRGKPSTNRTEAPSSPSSPSPPLPSERKAAEEKAAARSGGVDPQGRTPRFFKVAAPAPAWGVSRKTTNALNNKNDKDSTNSSSSSSKHATRSAVAVANAQLKETEEEQPPHWTVELDGRPVRTPGGALLLLPTLGLAAGVALEWEAQRERIEPGTMRLMTLCATSLDVVAAKRTKVIDALLSYLKTDTTSCRVSEDPELARLQDKSFAPLHKWFSQEFQLPPPPVARGVFAEEVPEQTMMELQWLLFDMSDFELAGLETIAHASKSLVIALAVWRNYLDFEDALRLTTLEENHQRKEWGDLGGMDQEMSDADLRVRITSGDVFLQLCSTR